MRPDSLYIVPALVVAGNLIYVAWLNQNQSSRGLDGLGAVLFLFFVLIPLSLVFLVSYVATALRLQASAQPRSPFVRSAIATLVGLAAAAATAGLTVGVMLIEAKL